MSDVAAEVAGSVGCAASANIGDDYAMFEAVKRMMGELDV